MLFELTGGSHDHGGKTYKKGDRIETNTDLVKKFKNKFKKIVIEGSKAVEVATAPNIPKKNLDTTDNSEAKNAPELVKVIGTDVSVSFPGIKGTKFTVYKGIGADEYQLAENNIVKQGIFSRADIAMFLRNSNA